MRILKSICILAACLWISTSDAQENYTRHTVAKGETITQIAQRYRVTPNDIYKLNPDSQSGVKEKDVLLIPSKSGVSKTDAKPSGNPSTHTAKPKETLYSISRQYNVSVDDLKAANPVLADGLKIGQVIKIPAGSQASSVASTPSKPAEPASKPAEKTTPKPTSTTAKFHVVEPKETKFGISKKYNLTVAELEKLNPGIEANLPVGYKLNVGGSSSHAVAEKPAPKTVTLESDEKMTDQYEVVKTTTKTSYANYVIKAKETMYSLTHDFNISEAELLKLNPHLKDGVKVGTIITVPGRGSIKLEQVSDKPASELAGSVSKDKKQLVLVLPFNATRIQGDTAKTLTARLKRDAFLNMTLDFYSGALMAIDSARTLGLNVDVKILDSEESKTGSNVADLAKDKNVRSADAIIGPFYQQYAEKLAESVSADNIPVISPLSKENGKSYPNLYQAMPSSSFTKSAMLKYMMAKGGNIIIVADPKRVSNREFITQNFPEARFAALDENGNFVADNLKAMFVKDKLNYVVIDSEKTGMILSTTNTMLNEMGNFQIQLAIIEPNETFDFEEISMKRLTILKLLYPSITRENNTPEAQSFEAAYRKSNKVFPNQYAVRGFDVTFDTLLRMTQPAGFSGAASTRTEQMQSQFNYAAEEEAGFMNNGVYILEFQEDLSVKQAQ